MIVPGRRLFPPFPGDHIAVKARLIIFANLGSNGTFCKHCDSNNGPRSSRTICAQEWIHESIAIFAWFIGWGQGQFLEDAQKKIEQQHHKMLQEQVASRSASCRSLFKRASQHSGSTCQSVKSVNVGCLWRPSLVMFSALSSEMQPGSHHFRLFPRRILQIHTWSSGAEFGELKFNVVSSWGRLLTMTSLARCSS